MSKKPMTTEEFFNKICQILKEKDLYPKDLLDYSLGALRTFELTNYEFNIRNNLDYGSNEGIYLDIYIYYKKETDDKYKTYELGTFKTLNEDRDSFLRMAKLLGDFIIEAHDYLNNNADDFEWEGYNIYPLRDNEKPSFAYCASTLNQALERKDKLLKSYPKVIIRNNKTRGETSFSS